MAVFKGQQAQTAGIIFLLEQETAFVAQEHDAADFCGGEIMIPLLQEGTVNQLTFRTVIQEADLGLGFMVETAVAADIAVIAVIEDAVAVGLVAVGFVNGSALLIRENYLVDGDAFGGNGLAVLTFQTQSDGGHPGSGFPGKLLRFGLGGYQMHVLSRDGNFVDGGSFLQIRIDTGKHIAFSVQNGIAIVGPESAVTQDHVFRTAAQFPAGVGKSSLLRKHRGVCLELFIQQFIHGFVVQVVFCQHQCAGSTAQDAQQGGSAEKDCK